MTFRERLMTLMASEGYTGMTKEELAEYFEMQTEEDYRTFFKVLYDMEKEGYLYLSKKNKYHPLSQKLYQGILEGNPAGFGIFIPDEGGEAIFIPPPDMAGALDRDHVLVKLVKKAEGDRKAEGKVVRILSPVDREVVGTLVKEGDYYFLEANNPNFHTDVFIPKKHIGKARANDKVVVRLTKRAKKKKNPEGRVIESLGSKFDEGVEVLSIAKDYGLRTIFPIEVDSELRELEDEVSEEDKKGRNNFSKLFTVTIDGSDAKDFDDAISIERKGSSYILYVHIADVSHYVKRGSKLDEEALKRGNSVYLLDRVIPMLPEKLSNNLCSLMPGKDRLVHTVKLVIDKKGQVRDYDFYRAVIKSDKRLVYKDVSDFLEGKNDIKDKKLAAKLKLMKELRDILYEKRLKRGALDFDTRETEFDLDKSGRIKDIRARERRIADSIIEEFMIACNECVAEHFGFMKYPFIFRIHEEPEKEKIAAFKSVVGPLGYTIKGEGIHPKDYQSILEKAKDQPEEMLISTLLLRTMQKAIYSTEAKGHFGLASSFYTHFTAPIRRYSDLVIHRIFESYILGKMKINNIDERKKLLGQIAAHLSDTERMADDAERAVEDYLKVEYMKELVGRTFTGIVSSLTSYGVYIELENTVEGLAAFRDMKDDYFIFDEDSYRVIGEETDKIVKIGMPARVQVSRVDEIRNEINFKVLDW